MNADMRLADDSTVAARYHAAYTHTYASGSGTVPVPETVDLAISTDGNEISLRGDPGVVHRLLLAALDAVVDSLPTDTGEADQ